MFVSILTVFFCFLSLTFDIRLTGIVFNYEEHNYKVINTLLTMICAAPTILLMNKELILPIPLRLSLIFIYYIGRLCLYFLIYRKVNLKLLYVFLFTINIPQIYLNIFKSIFNSYALANMVSFLLYALIAAFLLLYIEKREYKAFISNLVCSLPARLYALVLILTYIASIFVMGETKENHETYIKIFLLPAMIGLIAVTIAIIKIGISESEKKAAVELLSKQVENQIEYYEKINKIYDEFRSFRHDYKNHILCLRSLIAANEIDNAVDYMNDIEYMSSVDKKQYDTGNIIIDALLNDKSEKAQDSGANISFNGFVPTAGITNADLCIIMANAIDNAIEACSKNETNTIKSIDIKANFKQGYFFFNISNPLFEKVIFNEKKKIMTSKKEKELHGFGISNIIHTVEKYNGNTDISTSDGKFVLDIQLLLKEV